MPRNPFRKKIVQDISHVHEVGNPEDALIHLDTVVKTFKNGRGRVPGAQRDQRQLLRR